MPLGPVAGGCHVHPQRPILMFKRSRRVERDFAGLIRRVEEADVVDDHIHPRGEPVHRCHVVEIGGNRAE